MHRLAAPIEAAITALATTRRIIARSVAHPSPRGRRAPPAAGMIARMPANRIVPRKVTAVRKRRAEQRRER